MENHTERQLDMLRKIGVGVWKLRADADRDAAGLAEVQAVDVAAAAAESLAAAVDAPPAPAAGVSPTLRPNGDQPEQALARIQQAVAACRQCELHRSRANTVFGCGSFDAEWMFIGEAPGQHEDLHGQPFVGKAGQLLDRMIAALGMKREQVFIANILKCRPPGNRDPLAAEIEQCEPYLHQQLAQIKPKVIVALGRISAQALLKSTEPLSALRGQTHYYGRDSTPLIATYHPAYLLRSPAQKARAWEDLWQARLIARQSSALALPRGIEPLFPA